MKFHSQMIQKEYDHTVQILYNLENDKEFDKVKSLVRDKAILYNAVLNEYLYKSIAFGQFDFFSDNRYYENVLSKARLDIMMNSGMSEQNLVLYNVNSILEGVIQFLKKSNVNQKKLMNIGFVAIDLSNQQLCITDIRNQSYAFYSIVIERDINQVFGANSNNFRYFIKFRYLGRRYDK